MRTFLSSLIALFLFTSTAHAELVGEVKTSGMVFKDTIGIEAVDDPTIKGVTCYVTAVELGGPNWENPTDSSIACRQTGKISGELGPMESVFSKSKAVFFKNMRVDRFYDKKRNVLVYISYVRKLSGTNAAHSISVVPLSFPLK